MSLADVVTENAQQVVCIVRLCPGAMTYRHYHGLPTYLFDPEALEARYDLYPPATVKTIVLRRGEPILVVEIVSHDISLDVEPQQAIQILNDLVPPKTHFVVAPMELSLTRLTVVSEVVSDRGGQLVLEGDVGSHLMYYVRAEIGGQRRRAQRRGRLLRKLRLAHSMPDGSRPTQVAIARLSEGRVSVRHLSQLERGTDAVMNPKLEVLQVLAGIYGISAEDLLDPPKTE